MGVRARQKEATREAIVEAAYRLFSEKGLAATSTAEIARAAGISHGALFLHFPRREDLQREVIGRVGTKITRAVHEAAGGTVEELLRSHLRAIAEEEEFYRWLLIEAPLLGFSARSALIGVQSAVAHHFSEEGRGIFAPVETRAASAQEGDETARPSLLFNTWIGLVHHYLVNRDLFAPDMSVLERWGEVLISHFMSLIGAQGGRE